MSKNTFAPTLVLALILALLGSSHAALAQGCSDHGKISCAEGSQWDEEKATCTPKPST